MAKKKTPVQMGHEAQQVINAFFVHPERVKSLEDHIPSNRTIVKVNGQMSSFYGNFTWSSEDRARGSIINSGFIYNCLEQVCGKDYAMAFQHAHFGWYSHQPQKITFTKDETKAIANKVIDDYVAAGIIKFEVLSAKNS